MIKSEDKNIVNKGQFECSFCHSDHNASEGVEQPMKLVSNDYVK